MNDVISSKDIIIIASNYDYYTIAKELLDDFYKESFIKKPTLKKELRFWSSFVNKKYSLVIPIDIYSEKDIESLRKEIELVAGFKLDDCSKEYIIRQRM
jgi:hypothetical protein